MAFFQFNLSSARVDLTTFDFGYLNSYWTSLQTGSDLSFLDPANFVDVTAFSGFGINSTSQLFTLVDISSGTFTGYSVFLGGQYEVFSSGLDISAVDFFKFFSTSDWLGMRDLFLSGDDLIHGSVFSDRVYGADGYDVLFCGNGNDRAFGGRGGDQISGDKGRDHLFGGAGTDSLDGGLGNDVLTGGAGQDFFSFINDDLRQLSPKQGIDDITDFVSGVDIIVLFSLTFPKISGVGVMASREFTIGPAATNAMQRIIYDPASGNISYDPDGNGSKIALVFAHLNEGTAISNTDFIII